MEVNIKKFELRTPSPQNAVDIFVDHWASDISGLLEGVKAGDADHFLVDSRPRIAAKVLGCTPGRFDGMTVLELGPLEAAHSYQMEHLGAESVVSIEANVEAYLKCLIVKELLGLKRCRFLLGDFVEYLAQTSERFDLIFASGVLYHLPDPVRLLKLLAEHADRCFIWTHYYDEANYPGPERTARSADFGDRHFTYHEFEYPDMETAKFWGGNRPKNVWMPKQDLLDALSWVGFSSVHILSEEPAHENGACMTIAASR